MTVSPAILDTLKRQAIDMSGWTGILGAVSFFAFVAGIVIMIAGWAGRGEPLVEPLVGAAVTVAAIAGMIVSGHWHERRYLKAASQAGLSEAEAKALADQADAEDAD